MRQPSSLILELEVCLCVVVADAADNILQSLGVVGIHTVIHPTADQVTQNATEVLVTGVGDEAAGVGGRGQLR